MLKFVSKNKFKDYSKVLEFVNMNRIEFSRLTQFEIIFNENFKTSLEHNTKHLNKLLCSEKYYFMARTTRVLDNHLKVHKNFEIVEAGKEYRNERAFKYVYFLLPRKLLK